MAETARALGIAEEELSQALDSAQRKLLEARSRRPRPHLDDKILTSWNGLMISAFAKGAKVLDDSRYLDAAVRAADFLLRRMYDGERAALLRRFRDGDAAIPGFLDDYAFFVQGLLDLYEAEFDVRRLDPAVKLTDAMLERFEDREHGGFYGTAEGETRLVLRMKDEYDGAEPSGNSVATMNLLRLAEITGRDSYREAAARALRAFASHVRAAPVAIPQLLVSLAYHNGRRRQIVVVGDKEAGDTRAMVREVHQRFLPDTNLLLVDSEHAR
ncbi:MAG TPA: thioredoxin domain-containing protein, partial [Bryobacteraceae bacterium]|nr:thioredoxin domain-containing protein [Bryobacteraceae bacterium]